MCEGVAKLLLMRHQPPATSTAWPSEPMTRSARGPARSERRAQHAVGAARSVHGRGGGAGSAAAVAAPVLPPVLRVHSQPFPWLAWLAACAHVIPRGCLVDHGVARVRLVTGLGERTRQKRGSGVAGSVQVALLPTRGLCAGRQPCHSNLAHQRDKVLLVVRGVELQALVPAAHMQGGACCLSTPPPSCGCSACRSAQGRLVADGCYCSCSCSCRVLLAACRGNQPGPSAARAKAWHRKARVPVPTRLPCLGSRRAVLRHRNLGESFSSMYLKAAAVELEWLITTRWAETGV